MPYLSTGIFFCRSTKLIWSSNSFNGIGLWLHRLISTDRATVLILTSCCWKDAFKITLIWRIVPFRMDLLTSSISLHKMSKQNLMRRSKYDWCDLMGIPNETSWMSFNVCSCRISDRNNISVKMGKNSNLCRVFGWLLNAIIIFSISSMALPNGPDFGSHFKITWCKLFSDDGSSWILLTKSASREFTIVS